MSAGRFSVYLPNRWGGTNVYHIQIMVGGLNVAVLFVFVKKYIKNALLTLNVGGF